MGDTKRFSVMAEFIKLRFPITTRIADIAGGKGHLQTALRQLGFENVITFDKRKGRKDRPKMRYQYRYFDESIKDEFDLLVGMHPDGATDVIIKEAHRRNIDFAIVPCCIIPNAFAFWKKYTIKNWLDHLVSLSDKFEFKTEVFNLRIQGMNTLILGRRKWK